jgi:hypothetical protein
VDTIRRSATTAFLSLVVLLPACDTVGPERHIDVGISFCGIDERSADCPTGAAEPGEGIQLTVTVVPPPRVDIRTIIVSASGPLISVDTFFAPPGAGQTTVAVDTLYLPGVVGTLTVTAVAEGSGQRASGTATLAVRDTVPPTVVSVTTITDVMADTIQRGVWLNIPYEVTDNAALRRIVVRSTGDLAYAETHEFDAGTVLRNYQGNGRLQVPLDAPIGARVSFEVRATDVGGNTSVLESAQRRVLDTSPPLIEATLENGYPSTLLLPGDTLRGTITASDAHQLAWIGYRIGSPVLIQDSTPVTGSTLQLPLRWVVPAGLDGLHLLTVFARDSSGNVGVNQIPRQVLVIDAVRRPVRSAASQPSVIALGYDEARHHLLLLRSGDVFALDLNALSYTGHLWLPQTGAPGVDVLGGDTAVIPYGGFPPFLAFVGLAGGPLLLDTARLHAQWSVGTPTSIAIAANRKVFVSTQIGADAGLIEYDLLAGAGQLRADAGEPGGGFGTGQLVRSGDRSRVLLLWARGDGWRAQLYDPAPDAFSAPVAVDLQLSAPAPAGSADAAGTRFLFGGLLLGPDLQRLATFAMPSLPGYPDSPVISTLAPDGEHAYFSVRAPAGSEGMLVRLRLADGAILERILLPAFAQRLLALPDGATVIAEGSLVMVVTVE